MSVSSQDLRNFLDKAEQYSHTCNSVEIRILAYKTRDHWANLCTTVKLSIADHATIEEKLFEISDKLVVLQKTEQFDYDRFRNMVENLSGGHLTIDDVEVFFDAFNSSRIAEEKPNWQFDGLSDSEGWPAAILIGQGTAIPNLMKEPEYNELNQILIKQKDPLDNLTRLSLKYIGLRIGFNFSTCVYVILPIYCKLDGIEVHEEGEFSVSLKCYKSFLPSDLALSILCYDGLDRVYGGWSLLDSFKIEFGKAIDIDNKFVKYQTHKDLTCKGVSLVQCHVVYRGTILQTYDIPVTAKKKEKNMRLIAHEALDEDLDGLLGGLDATKKKHFEPAVVMLLHLVGFNVEHVGSIEAAAGRPFMDFVAFTPDNSYILVGGCTVEGVAPEDIDKIAERAKTISRAYSGASAGPVTVEPILVTSLTSGDISESAKKRAEEDELTIIDKDTLMEMLKKMRSGDTTDQLLREFQNLIVQRRQARLFQKGSLTGIFQSMIRGGFRS
nr:hypothetical protein [Candidatus Njordarchaeota archaeon]